MKNKVNAEKLGIADKLPNTMTYDNQVWKVVDRMIQANINCSGEDEKKNPKTRLVETKWLSPKEINQELDELEAEYSDTQVTWARDKTHMFREVVNEGGRSKDMETFTLQREFKDGKWSVSNPIDIEKELEGEQPVEEEKESEGIWGKLKKYKALTWALIIALVAMIIALLASMAKAAKYIKGM